MINGFPIAASSSQPQLLGFPHAGAAEESRQDGTALSFLGILMQVVAGVNPQVAGQQAQEQAEAEGGQNGSEKPSGQAAAAQTTGAEAILQSLASGSSAGGSATLTLFPAFKNMRQAASPGAETATPQETAVTTEWTPQGEELPQEVNAGMQELLSLMQPAVDENQLQLPLAMPQPVASTNEKGPATVPAQAATLRQMEPQALEAAMAVSAEMMQATENVLPRMEPKESTRTASPESPKSTHADRSVESLLQPGDQATLPVPQGKENQPVPAKQTLQMDPTPESVVNLLRGVERSVPVLMNIRLAVAAKASATTPPRQESPTRVAAEPEIDMPVERSAAPPVVFGEDRRVTAEKNQKEAGSDASRDKQGPVASVQRETNTAEPTPALPVMPAPERSQKVQVRDQQPPAEELTSEKPQPAKFAADTAKSSRKEEPLQSTRTGDAAQGVMQAAQKSVHELHKGVTTGTVGVDSAGKETAAGIHAGSVIDQIAKSLAASIQSGSQEIRLELHPKELGSVTVKVMVEQNGVAAQIDVKDPGVKAVLENNLPQLREAFQREHLEVNRVEIALASEGTPQESTRQWGGRQQSGRNADTLDDEAPGQESSRSLGYNTMELTM
jgi:flagellar hook-length control protein FliK